MKKWLILAVSVLIVSISITTISAQSSEIPSWIKNTALWWGQDQISDDDLLSAIQFLIKEGILVIPEEPQSQIDPPSLQLDAEPSDNTIETTTSISIKMDDNSYNEGDTLVISGVVNIIIGKTPIFVQIIHEATYVHLAQIEVAQDGTFSETVIAEGPLWKNAGEYLVKASYQDQITETEFDYTPKSDSIETTTNFEVDAGSYGTFDVEYTIKGGSVENMVIDSDIFAIIVQIDSTDEGTITLDLPREFIGAEKQDGKDDTFIILIDGIEVSYQESLVHSNSRVITVNFEEGDVKITIIGNFLLGNKS